VAEVASTFNEALLLDYMLKTIKDDDARLTLLGSYLDGLRGTLIDNAVRGVRAPHTRESRRRGRR